MNIAFIDGENTKGRIKEVFHKYGLMSPDWEKFDFKGLFDNAFSISPVEIRKFFRANPKPHMDLKKESEALIKSYRSLGGHLHRQGFEVIKAGSLRADYKSSTDKKPKYREKGVDVYLAVTMVTMACDGKVTNAYLVASDSDYQPAVSEVKNRGKKIIYVGFEVNPNLGLIAKTDDRIIISDADVLKFGGIDISKITNEL